MQITVHKIKSWWSLLKNRLSTQRPSLKVLISKNNRFNYLKLKANTESSLNLEYKLHKCGKVIQC
jgi:hypothetical protein